MTYTIQGAYVRPFVVDDLPEALGPILLTYINLNPGMDK